MTGHEQATILSPFATEAVCRVAAEIEPSASAQLIQRPGSLLTVLVHAARLGAEAAAPHIRADAAAAERERIRQQILSLEKDPTWHADRWAARNIAALLTGGDPS